ncbi:Amiloride-sensitive sodium channel subunit alpha, partial [Paramuricea clavata]
SRAQTIANEMSQWSQNNKMKLNEEKYYIKLNFTCKKKIRNSAYGCEHHHHHSLTLDLFIEQGQYIQELSEEAGVKVVIIESNQHPFPYQEGLAVSPGAATAIALRKEVVQRVDRFSNKSCIDDSENFDSIYNEDVPLAYTIQSCLDTCLSSKSKCNQAIQIYNETQRKSLNRTQKFQKSVKTKDDFKKDFLRIKIYFEELNLIQIHQEFSYSITTLLSDIGGQLGLWVGLSVITFAEVGDLLLSVIMLAFSKDK